MFRNKTRILQVVSLVSLIFITQFSVKADGIKEDITPQSVTNEKIVSSIIDYNKSTYEFGEIVEDQDISVFSNVRLNINKKNWELIQIIEGNVIFNIPDFIKLSDNGLTV